MREQQRTVYVAFDGTEFPSASACREHERGKAHERLVGLTPEQIGAALDRSDPELAEALEIVGDRIKAARLAAGEYKRKRSAENGEPATEPQPQPSTPPADDEPEIPENLRRTAETQRSEGRPI